jgi:hypothetical protein
VPKGFFTLILDSIFILTVEVGYKIELRGDSMRRAQDGGTATPAENQERRKGGKLADETSLS